MLIGLLKQKKWMKPLIIIWYILSLVGIVYGMVSYYSTFYSGKFFNTTVGHLLFWKGEITTLTTLIVETLIFIYLLRKVKFQN